MRFETAGLAMIVAAATTMPAWGRQPAKTVLSTYLRAGPGHAYAALDEVEHDTRLLRLGCADGWCRVRRGAVEGYVDQLALDAPAPPAVPGGRECVSARLADDLPRRVTRLCGPATPPPAAASGVR